MICSVLGFVLAQQHFEKTHILGSRTRMIRLRSRYPRRERSHIMLRKRFGRGFTHTAANVGRRLGDLGRIKKQGHMEPKLRMFVLHVGMNPVRFACMNA